MSEEINSSHLCTTEDAFEKFQAVSMYQEDEFITLSDIVPTQAQAPDPMGEICDIPYEDEVVLESNLVDQVFEVNSTNESGFDENKSLQPVDEHIVSSSEVAEEVVVGEQSETFEVGPSDVPDAGHNNTEAGHDDNTLLQHQNHITEDDSNKVITDTAQTKTSRRGRKKKITAEIPPTHEPKDDTKQVETNAPEYSDKVLNTSGQRRRGRPPKHVSNRSTITPLKEDLQNENIVQNSPVKKRGRPRKAYSNQHVSEPTSSSDADCQDVNKNIENVAVSETDFAAKSPEKRMKRMRLLSSEKSESDLNERKEILDQNSDSAQNHLNVKVRGKRGRKSKKILDKVELNGTQQIPSSDTDLETGKTENQNNNDDDDGDDICLSKLKTSLDSHDPTISQEAVSEVSVKEKNEKEPEINEFSMEIEISEENAPGENDLNTLPNKTEAINSEINSLMPEMTDFEENIDKIVSVKKEQAKSENENVANYNDPNSLLVEDTSKRPTRRRTRKPLQYDEGSDEDPFANIELSDDEPIGCKKKYYSDDEYIPGKNKKGKQSDSSESDSDMDMDNIEEELLENKRKRSFKKTESSPIKGAKKGRKSVNEKAPEIVPPDNKIAKGESGNDDDIEICLKPSIIKTNEDKKNKDIESFLAKKIHGTDIQIKKKSTVQPFEIPVIDPKEQKKTTENSSQTNKVVTTSAGVQTIPVYDIPMKENVMLTSEQSEKACEFLNSIVKTTSELGELMTQKSQDFMKKKINVDHVTDTFKMDYCVRKSFLLFKLAKHNLMQMEEDLAKQYDTFLNTHNLQQHREQPKVVTAAPKTEGSDSDCEIIDAPVIQKPQKKKPAAFNPKTVFLNKELSIKIAKKTPTKDTKPEGKKIDIKGRHTVWINDSVMVKKVKPTQSFLAQDSRNKKPPDYVTIEMVHSFFKQYYRRIAVTACAPYVSTEWLAQKSNVCCYFFANTDNISVSTEVPSSSSQCIVVNGNFESNTNSVEQKKLLNPKTLFSLCTQVLQNYLSNMLVKTNDMISSTPKFEHNPQSLYWLCLNTINTSHVGAHDGVNCPLPPTSQHQDNVHPNDATNEEKYLDDFSSAPLMLDQVANEDSACSSPLSLLDQEENGEAEFLSPFILSNQDWVSKKPEFALPSLKTLCYNQTLKQMFIKDQMDSQETILHDLNRNKLVLNLESGNETQTFLNDVTYQEDENFLLASPLQDEEADEDAEYSPPMLLTCHRNGIKSLSSLCSDLINSLMSEPVVVSKRKSSKKATHKPKTLKCLTFDRIVNLLYTNENLSIVKRKLLLQKIKSLSDICFEIVTKFFSDSKDSPLHDGLTINSINTMTEEAYHNIQHAELPEDVDYYDDDDSNFYDDRTESCLNNLDDDNANADNNLDDDNATADNNWLSQVQMQELRSCYSPNIPLETETNLQDATNNMVEEQHLLARVKVEPAEEFQENIDSLISVKTEHLSHHPDEMTIIPENIITKTEYEDAPATSSVAVQRQNSSSYDVDSFEAFVATNKMMHNLNELPDDDEEIFSQSALRVRRQFEPDDLSENDLGMSLLIPQTFEPLRIENNAKDCLMESSSDESTNSKKVPGKKKTEKRPRGKPKKNESKTSNNKGPVIVPPKEKTSAPNEIAILTRRMREKIRQEEKKVVSSESENESETVVTKKSKQKEEKNKAKSSKVLEDDKDSPTTAELENPKPADSEIQCSNVDSTEQINEGRNSSPSISHFTGFTAVDQNEITSYQKYVKYVYDQILPRVTEQADPNRQHKEDQPVINPDDPVELLECEPSMPYFPEEPTIVKRRPGPKTKTEIKEPIKALPKDENKIKPNDDISKNENFIERHGWKCYPLDGNDTKLYQNAQIVLEKLPESFVQTYFMYQDVASKDNEDDEVDRLINLQTLNRSAIKDGKSNKSKQRSKNADKISDQLGNDNIDKQGIISPTFSENADELTPSEDEGGRIEDELPPPVKPPSDNNLAKNSLMDDNDSDADQSGVPKVKDEPVDVYDNPIKSRSKKSKSKAKAIEETPGPVMLTADKMMNKELNLLHAPINLDDTVEPTPSKGRASKHKQKSTHKTSPKENVKAENDSSEEEEKHQWFTIKEKLLKRMVKKSDTTREDDAKRAKLVSEFIERRGDSSEAYIKRRGFRGSRRISKKKLLERQKQLKVLSHELFGDASNDVSLHPKRSQQAYFKGRRNIRKVIDKKSLARSTVVANMEEFERKRRINIRQSRLREIMQCEDGVNVLVINDEVCLEYDFEAHRPVVTIHPFFTKVMKAHQYEGVKFMWDACFESLESIAAGQPGGGCILAHCMGLGKTLQVLALLHTVLTHPRVGMQRVLVCCPLSTVLNWVDEIHKWIGPVTNQIKVFELSKLKKTSNRAYQLEDWYNGGGIFIIGYELFRSLSTLDPFLDNVRPAVVKKIRTALLDPGPDIIICDEGHLLKNDCSVLAVAMSRVVTKRRIVLTGTPMQNNLREYYCMVNFVKPNLLGTYSEYSNRFENPIMNGQHRDSREEDIKLMKARTHILHKVLEGCLQRQEASVLYPYLPKKHEYTVFISLTQCQWDLYKHYLQNYSNTQNNKSVLKDFHILQKIWSHPQVLHNFQNRTGETTRNKVKEEKLEDDLAREDLNATEDIKPTDTEVWWLQYLEDGAMLESLASSNKFVAVFRILEESIALNDKVLIFSTSLFTMDTLEYFLKKINNWSLGQEYYRLDGSVPAEVRQKWCREFNAENNHKTKLFLISTRAGCLGLNMTAANRVIILDTSWNPAHDIQSIFRVYRFGQKKDCYIYRLVALGTMEQKIYERSVTKQAVACRVVDEQQIDRHYNMAELTELYKFDETGAGVAGGVAVGVEDIVLLRVARDAALHAVHEHDSLLRGSLEQGLPEHERDAAWVQFQEEHAHKQQMQEMVAPVKIKKVKVKMPSQPHLTPPVEPPSIPAVPDWPVKTETEESILPNDPEYTPVQRPKPRGKKGRPSKSNIVSCCIPIQPEAPEAPEVNEPATADEDMIRQITHILLKYNYQNNQGPKEIAELVSRVRGLVYSGKMDQLDSSDELTMSIARVLLGRSPKAPMPPLTDIAEDIRNDVPSEVKQEPVETPEPGPRSRGRPRRTKKGYVYDAVPSTSTQPDPEPDADGRRRRRAALAAEKNFESPPVGDPVVDLEPMDEDSGDNEFLPELPIEYDAAADAADSDSTEEIVISNVEIKKETDVEVNTSKKPSKKPTKTYERIKAKQKNNETPPISESQSILLSDDDDAPSPLVKKKPGPARKTIKTEKIESPASSKDSEVVPLHPSLLSNKNFIKIVAHTYLSGNPMLDEDAATLAAQYSTFKALKEYESNGRSIDSGPIYDIATQVLGKEVLKKLHKSNVKVDTSDILAQHPINSQDGAAGQGPVLKQALTAPDKKTTESTDKKTIETIDKKGTKKSQKPDAEPSVQNSRSLLRVTSEAAAPKSTLHSAPKSTLHSAPKTLHSAPKSTLHSAPKSTLHSAPKSMLHSAPKLPKLAPKPQVAAPVAPEPSAPDKKPMGIKVRLPGALNSTPYSMPLTSVTSSPANVVPVGLFKTAAETPAGETPSTDECILPDDDDIRIVADPAPAVPPAPAAPHSVAAGRNVHPVALTVTADTRHAYPTPAPAGIDYGTIDITSDDEEPAPVPAQPYAYVASPAPVPVSLTAVRPSDLPPHLRTAPRQPRIVRQVVAPPTRTAPILLNSVADVPAGVNPVVSNAGQYILVPASSLTRVTPVSLDQVQYHLQAAPQPRPAHPVPAQELQNVIPLDSHVTNPLTADIGAEQTVETTDPANVAKGGKRLCKPGDILRVTKGGAIEVLNRKDITELYPKNKQEVAATPPPPDTSGQTRKLRGNTTPAPATKPKTVTAEKKIDNQVASRNSVESTPMTPTAYAAPKRTSTGLADRASTGSVSVVAARSPSPSDIFKNVVHIAADDYVSLVDDSPSPSASEKEPTEHLSAPSKKPAAALGDNLNKMTSQGKLQSTTTAKTPASTAKTSTSTKPPASNTTSTKPSTSTAKSSVSSNKLSSSTAKPSMSTAKTSTSTAPTAKPSTSIIKPSTSTSKPSTSTAKPSTSNTKSLTSAKGNAANKSKERILDLVDLTDLDYVSPTPASTKKKTQPNTIVGTSKSIILCSSGKAVSKPLAPKTSTPAKIAPKVEKGAPAKLDVKKRPAPADNSSAKKKKTDKPMTLKDFDIDDIDDIIELD